MNQITRIVIERMENGAFQVLVTKQFAPKFGGGEQTFKESAGSLHHALDVARGMVTCLPARMSPEVLKEEL